MRQTLVLSAALLFFLGFTPTSSQAQEDAAGLASPSPEAANPSLPPAPSATVPENYGPPRPVYPSSEANVAAPAPSADPLRIRMRALESHLGSFGQNSSRQTTDAILGLVAGGSSIALAFYIEDPGTSAYMYAFGGSYLARAILDLSIRPDPVDANMELAGMPQETPSQLSGRVAFAERALEELAGRHRLLRLIDGGLNIALSAAIVPILYSAGGFGFDNHFDYIVLSGALGSAISGLVTLLRRSVPERRWASYQALRARLDGGASDANHRRAENIPSWQLTLAPSPSGGHVGFVRTF